MRRYSIRLHLRGPESPGYDADALFRALQRAGSLDDMTHVDGDRSFTVWMDVAAPNMASALAGALDVLQTAETQMSRRPNASNHASVLSAELTIEEEIELGQPELLNA